MTLRPTWLRCAIPALLLGTVSCATDQQSAISPAGAASDYIAKLWWGVFWVLVVVTLLVFTAVLWTLTRRKQGAYTASVRLQQTTPQTEAKTARVVTACVLATILILFGILIASVATGKAVYGISNYRNPLTIEVTGNQWWWQIRYMNGDASQIVVTANEIHIPVGRPVQIRGLSNDVIHSFWVPNLNGKRDLIPSRVTTEWIEANQPGTFRGQCAEFCGVQHAHMILYVIAEPQDKFSEWYRQQLRPAMQPIDADLMRGQQVFMNNACIFCHQIRGTSAGGQNGPDLTHFGSRLGIAANTLPNNKGNLGGWIVDPQTVKPGNHMATVAVNSQDLQPLIDYLESLK